jgi:presenilin-like A22 family membrane protease
MKKLVLTIILFFTLAQLFGILTGIVLFRDMNVNPYVQEMKTPVSGNDLTYSLYLFAYVLIGAVVMLVFIRKFKSDLAFFLMEFTLISGASSLVFYALLRLLVPGTDYLLAMALGIVFGLALAISKNFVPNLKNPAAILSSAGAGALFGVSLGIGPLLVFLLLLSLYDYVAVFKTKHMVEFANYMVKKDMAFTVTSKGYVEEEKKERRIDLGTGDMVMPVMIEVALLPISPIASLFAFIGAAVAIGTFLLLALRKKMVLPALPPIAVGMLVFFFIGKGLGLY